MNHYYIFFFHQKKNKIIYIQKISSITQKIKINIYFNDEFYQLKDVKKQMKERNITYIKTLFCERLKTGNALIVLNNLINICENIGCKNIIIPLGLDAIIKRTIFYKEKNIRILPYTFKRKIKSDIDLDSRTIYFFNYKNKRTLFRLRVIREEILRNIPKYKGSENDLIIKLRSGDIFTKFFNNTYYQPPLCFYKKIIKENNFEHITILSNGYENPVVNELIKLYPKIHYTEGTIQEAISLIIYAYIIIK